ncbi:probable G-protein coupled receptor 158 [Patiria miniata]|uniref:G-protein coupled receptors family 3 profile domain-containing protein n=1 Tax=Patiria miniata TaxID=46514 RepID=A0A914B6K7_PATMI|nr:probable G-protein coupled receptor 158 [Patiria miniata]
MIGFRGVATADVDVRTIDINQCDDGGGAFAGTHRCSNTTKCVHVPGMGFQSGTYRCVCRDSFYFPHQGEQSGGHFEGADVEREYHLLQMGQPNRYEEGFACLPCREGCETCLDDSPCFLENDILLRILILSVQGICIFLTGVLIAVVFKYKNLKVINCDSPWMLIVVLLGAFLLYCELVAMFFHPTVLVCFMQRWLRGWGFAIAYGMLVLKIYRKLAIFQTRSATRVLVRDRDVLKWLVLIVIVLTGYLAAWTAFSVQSMRNCKVDIVTIGFTDTGMKFSMCMMEWWDYVIEIIEFLFLLFGIYLCYSVRAAPSEFHETRYISVAIYNETIFSTFLYISRHFIWGKVAPDWIYLMYFLRSQLTTTVMLALIFIPKLKVIHKLLHDESFRERVNSRVVYDGKWHNSFRRPNSSSSNVNNDHNFNPEDVREELKRLYTQLEVYKTKSLRIDNPHLPSKKKSNVSKWRAPRRFSRGYSLRTHSGHSESERSSEIARSNESLGKAVELHDYRVNHVDPTDQSHCSSQKWLCQQ